MKRDSKKKEALETIYSSNAISFLNFTLIWEILKCFKYLQAETSIT